MNYKKWFAATRDIEYKTLGIERDGRVGIVNVKLGLLIVTNSKMRGFCTACHMKPYNWFAVLVDIPDEDEEIYKVRNGIKAAGSVALTVGGTVLVLGKDVIVEGAKTILKR